MRERRKFPRLEVADIFVNWRKKGGFDNLHKTRNISEGGMCLATHKDRAADIGDNFHMEFKLPQGKTIYSKAKVIWTSGPWARNGSGKETPEVGIEFTYISNPDREIIRDFVLSNLSLEQESA
jgi:c-di-GMP-binding flagellar brake protein YcgR